MIDVDCCWWWWWWLGCTFPPWQIPTMMGFCPRSWWWESVSDKIPPWWDDDDDNGDDDDKANKYIPLHSKCFVKELQSQHLLQLILPRVLLIMKMMMKFMIKMIMMMMIMVIMMTMMQTMHYFNQNQPLLEKVKVARCSDLCSHWFPWQSSGKRARKRRW